MKLYGHKDRWGDVLEVQHHSAVDEDGPGVTLSIAPQDDARRAFFLADSDAQTMLKELADALGYHLVAKGGEPRG